MKYNSLREGIVQCRTYEQNGLPEFLKAEVRGIRRSLELRLDRMKIESREANIEMRYAN